MSNSAVAIRSEDSGVAVVAWGGERDRPFGVTPPRAKSLGKGPRRVVSAPPVPPLPEDIAAQERIAEFTGELPPEKQAEVLEFVELLRSNRGLPVEPRRGSLEALHAVLAGGGPPPDDEPDWSPFDIEPADMGEPDLSP